jgi:hypothetical protein
VAPRTPADSCARNSAGRSNWIVQPKLSMKAAIAVMIESFRENLVH